WSSDVCSSDLVPELQAVLLLVGTLDGGGRDHGDRGAVRTDGGQGVVPDVGVLAQTDRFLTGGAVPHLDVSCVRSRDGAVVADVGVARDGFEEVGGPTFLQVPRRQGQTSVEVQFLALTGEVQAQEDLLAQVDAEPVRFLPRLLSRFLVGPLTGRGSRRFGILLGTER